MPDISMTQQTSLRGAALQNAVNTMVANISRRSPYNLVGLTSRWSSGNQLVLNATGHMSGSIDIRDGTPSTVTVQINLLSSLAQGRRAQVEADMRAEAQRGLGAAVPTARGTTMPRTARQPRARSGNWTWGAWGVQPTTPPVDLAAQTAADQAALDQQQQQPAPFAITPTMVIGGIVVIGFLYMMTRR